MTDTLTRLAMAAPAQTTAGTLLYTVPGATTTALKNILIANTDPLLGAFLTLGIGSDLTVMANRIYSSLYIPPGDTVYLPLDLVLAAGETLYARQSCQVSASEMTVAAAVAATNAGSATSIVSASWTEANNDLLLLTVGINDAAAVVSGFTDTHAGVSWTLLQTQLNTAATLRISQYTAQSTGTTSATTTVTFDSTADASCLSIDKITALTSIRDDASGTNGSTAFRALGASEGVPSTTPLLVADEMGAAVFCHQVHAAAAYTQTVMTGWTEVDDFGTTNAATINSSRLLAPASWNRPTIVTGTAALNYAFAEILNNKRSLTVTLNGVQVT